MDCVVAFNQPMAQPRPRLSAVPRHTINSRHSRADSHGQSSGEAMPRANETELPGDHDKQDWLRLPVVANVCVVIHTAYMCTCQLPTLIPVIQMTFSHYRCMRRLIHIYVYHAIRHRIYIYIRMQPQATHPPREAERCDKYTGCGLGDRVLREGHTSDMPMHTHIH